MAKANKVEEKKAFAWDSEVLLKTIEEDKVKTEIKICTLKGKEFVVITKWALYQKDGWKPVKNTTIEHGLLMQAVEVVDDHRMQEMFNSAQTIEAKKPSKPKKAEAVGKALAEALASVPMHCEKHKRNNKNCPACQATLKDGN
jgi:hypothetical protein